MAEFIDNNEMFFTNFEPKTQNRFILYVEGLPAFLIHVANRPSITFGDIVIDHMNVKRKLKGKADWQDVTITLYDPITPSGAQAAMEWVRLSHESVTGQDGYADFYKKDVTINVLGPALDKVEEWTLKGAYVASTAMGDMSWANDGFMTVGLVLKYDYAILQF
jgi:hypothetical protein